MSERRINISGTFPHLAFTDKHGRRTETGVGALMPWADRLWAITYVAHIQGEGGTGLFEIDAELNITKRPESVTGTYANRMIHKQTEQLIIGPHVIDAEGNVRTIEGVAGHRLTATAAHLEAPESKVYFVTMEGLLFEADVNTLESRQVCSLLQELDMGEVTNPHFKDAYTGHGRLVVANNTYNEHDYPGKPWQGRLAEWDGKKWTLLETCQFNAVTGRGTIGDAILATGYDHASVLLKVFCGERWDTYRLPKATHTQDHTWTTEWPRIREVESERWLMDAGGMFYELPAMQYGGKVWGVRPISSHLRIIGDFCTWNGLMVLAGDQGTPLNDANPFIGQPTCGLWFGITDDLWKWGKPAGWGGPWLETPVKAGEPSDPFLMCGFEHKGLHLTHDADKSVEFEVQVDFVGDGRWKTYDTFTVDKDGYAHHEFPTGFSAQWVRVVPGRDCNATAWFIYT
jgi:hypothetical protein